MRQCEPSTLRAVGEGHDDAIPHHLDRRGARLGEHGHAVALEDILDDACGIRILARQNLVAARDQRHVRPERRVCRGEFGTGDARPDHDQRLGCLVEGVELGPGEDALPSGTADGRMRGWHRRPPPACPPRPGRSRWSSWTCRPSRWTRRSASARPGALAVDDPHPGLDELRLHVIRLRCASRRRRVFTAARFTATSAASSAPRRIAREELHAEIRRLADQRTPPRPSRSGSSTAPRRSAPRIHRPPPARRA